MAENIRTGLVSSVDAQKGTVKVTYADKDDTVSSPLHLTSSQQRMPRVGSNVITLTLENGEVQGFCLGEYYDDDNLPPTQNEDEYVIDFEGAKIMSERGSGVIEIYADKLIIKCPEVEIEGKVNVKGQLMENDRQVQVM